MSDVLEATPDNLNEQARAVNFEEFAGMTPDQLIGFYVALRDRIDAENKKFAERLEPAKSKMARLGGVLLAVLQAQGAESLKSANGTVYQTVKKSATVSDKGAFRDFVIDNHAFELADMKANAPAIEEYVSEHGGNLPPGVNYSTFMTIGVRRATK